RWPIITTLTLVLTTIYQWAWVIKFLNAASLPLAAGIFLFFPLLALFLRAIGGGYLPANGGGGGRAGGARAGVVGGGGPGAPAGRVVRRVLRVGWRGRSATRLASARCCRSCSRCISRRCRNMAGATVCCSGFSSSSTSAFSWSR